MKDNMREQRIACRRTGREKQRTKEIKGKREMDEGSVK